MNVLITLLRRVIINCMPGPGTINCYSQEVVVMYTVLYRETQGICPLGRHPISGVKDSPSEMSHGFVVDNDTIYFNTVNCFCFNSITCSN